MANARLLLDALSYLYKFQLACGCVSIQRVGNELQVTPFAQIYANGMRVLVLVGFFSGIAFKFMDPESFSAIFDRMSPVHKVILSWECVASSATYLFSCAVLDIKRTQHLNMLRHMQQLDDGIVRVFPHVRWHYEKTRTKYKPSTVVVFVTYFILLLVFEYSLARCYCGYMSTLLITITYATMTVSLGLISFVHIAHMDYLRLRYRLLQKLLAHLYDSSLHIGPDQGLLHARIDSIYDYAKACTLCIRQVNDTFGIVSAAGLFYNFMIMTTFVFIICEKLIDEKHDDIVKIIFILLLLIMYTYKVAMSCIYGYYLNREKQNCHHALTAYGVHFFHVRDVREIVCRFEHWKLHNDYRITFGSYLRCNLGIIFMIWHAITNYVLILIQLFFQQIRISNNLKVQQQQQQLLQHVALVPNDQLSRN